jgi:uncharacterized protein YdhG (YjbR/CyaY superfamily)
LKQLTKNPLESAILKGFSLKHICMMQRGQYSNVDEYIAIFPASTRAGLVQIRKTIKAAAPKAEELISYRMPAYRLNGMLVYFAAMKNHYGFYPTAAPMDHFREKLKKYETSKGAIRFPLDQPIPVKLITDIVKWKIKDNLSAVKPKKKS